MATLTNLILCTFREVSVHGAT